MSITLNRNKFKYKNPSGSGYRNVDLLEEESKVNDVQVNGTSVVTSGVANIDLSGKADKADTVLDTTLSRGRTVNSTVATGSFAFGQNVEASGTYSHAEGHFTNAASMYQHVQGKYNVADSNDVYADIVGNGTSDTHSNAFALTWEGDGKYAGDVYVGANADSSGGSKLARESIIAPAEAATATSAHAIGDKFILDGQLCKATAVIAIGDTITTTGTNANAEVTNVADELSGSGGGGVEPDGYYPQMTVGNAEQLVSTVGVDDQNPYLFRTAGGPLDIGEYEEDKTVGGTLCWNQWYDFTQESSKWLSNGSVTKTWNDGIVTLSNGSTDSAYVYQNITEIASHKYLYYVDGETTVIGDGATVYPAISIYATGATTNITVSFGTSGRKVLSGIFAAASDFTNRFQIRPNHTGSSVKVYSYMLFDLTQMFGSTIADYIYSLEIANSGAGVAWFRKYFPKPYYAYNAGELMSVQTSAHKMVGFNQFDGTTVKGHKWTSGEYVSANNSFAATSTKIPCIPNREYCFYFPNLTKTVAIYFTKFDANGNYISNTNYYNLLVSTKYITYVIPDDVHYITFFMYAASDFINEELEDVCVNLSWDGERDGEYEPYEEHVYPLDSDLVLRGQPKLDANNDLYYNGDTYEADGTVTRKYGIVDLGTLTWNLLTPTNETDRVFQTNVPNKILGWYNFICSAPYTVSTVSTTNMHYDGYNKVIRGHGSNNAIYIRDDNYDTAALFKAAMSEIYLVFELETPTTESADPYTNPQVVNDFGTEEYTDTRTIPIPVGHETWYPANLRAKLEMAPNSPDGDGDYIVRQTNGENEYVPLNAVSDVKVNGSTVVTNGVANVPLASNSAYGVVKVHIGDKGLAMASGYIGIYGATDADLKASENAYRPVTPSKQHSAVFYGLAKAAGDITQASSVNAVGTYTETAKSAINSMLNAPEAISGTTPTIVAKAGIQYVCGEVATLDFTPSQTGVCEVIFTSGSTPAVLTVPNTVKFPSWFDVDNLEADTTYEINILNGVYGTVMLWQ